MIQPEKYEKIIELINDIFNEDAPIIEILETLEGIQERLEDLSSRLDDALDAARLGLQ